MTDNQHFLKENELSRVGKFATKPNKFFVIMPIIISLVALVASVYSVVLTRESHYIKKTQTLVGKRYEILSAMKELLDLKNTEYDLVQKIIWTYRDNKKLLDKEKDRHSYWEGKKDEIRKDIEDEQEIQHKFLKDKINNIEMLENYVGYYKLSVNYAISDVDRAKRFLAELEERLHGAQSINTTQFGRRKNAGEEQFTSIFRIRRI